MMCAQTLGDLALGGGQIGARRSYPTGLHGSHDVLLLEFAGVRRGEKDRRCGVRSHAHSPKQELMIWAVRKCTTDSEFS